MIKPQLSEFIHSLYKAPGPFFDLLIKETSPISLYNYPPSLNILPSKDLHLHLEREKTPYNLSLIHSIAHIEYNAMGGYLDTIRRFLKKVPFKLQKAFFEDFLQVCNEEACHFDRLEGILKGKGGFYGFLPGIEGIREDLIRTEGDLIERIFIIALVQEGKGLDAGEGLLNRLTSFYLKNGSDGKKEEEFVILKKIIKEEEGHVRNGVKWFKLLVDTKEKGKEKEKFKEIAGRYGVEFKKMGKMNWKARERAGFERDWIDLKEI